MVAIMQELGIPVDLTVKSDAVAAVGIVKRQGLGRVRHLAVGDLWVQQRAKNKEVNYVKLPVTTNTSDNMTNPDEGETKARHQQSIHKRVRKGRHAATPEYKREDSGIPGGDPE